MNQAPKVSIIVPVYKAEKYLHRCVDSILAQTFTDFELLLVDDGSPDRSGDICDQYAAADPRVRVFHKPNGGVGSARNLGLDNTCGEWITFVDADDFCETTYLENFSPYGSIENELIIQGYKTFVNDNILAGKNFEQKLYNKGSIVEGLIENDLLTFGAPYCKLFKKKIIQKYNIEFSTKYSYGEDTYFFFDYLTHVHHMSMVDGCGYLYQCNNSESLSMKNHDFNDLLLFADESLNLLRLIDDDKKLEIAYSRSYVGLYSRALANMYRLGYSRKERVNHIAEIHKNKEHITCFKGLTLYKAVYLLVKKCPPFVADFFLYVNYKLRG